MSEEEETKQKKEVCPRCGGRSDELVIIDLLPVWLPCSLCNGTGDYE